MAIDKPSDYFNTKLYTGNGSTQSITGVGFTQDFTWIKIRSETNHHRLLDTVRGATKELYADLTSSEVTTANGLTSFDSDGFSLSTDHGYNKSGATYVSWNWLAGGTASSNTDGSITSSVSANTTAGFSIVSYTGTGSTATVGHGLSQEPDILIIKNRSVSNRWLVYTKLIDGTFDFLQLNTTDAKTNSSVTPFTSSVFSVINNADSGTSGNNYIAYAFHSVKAYSKMGIYTGNGSTDGTFVYTGFKPAFVMIKQTDTTRSWHIYDSVRSPSNQVNVYLAPDQSQGESPAFINNNQFDFLSNGFKLRSTNTGSNDTSGTYIYMAFAESPFVTGDSGIPTTAR